MRSVFLSLPQWGKGDHVVVDEVFVVILLEITNLET